MYNYIKEDVIAVPKESTPNNANAEMNAGVTVAVGEAVMKNMEELQKQLADGTAQIIKEVQIQGGATRVAIKNAKGEIIEAVKTSEGNLMSEIQWQNWYNRYITIDQGRKTRKAVSETAQQTQELNGYSDKINAELEQRLEVNNSHLRISNMRNTILKSDLPYEQRRELMAHLASFCDQEYYSEKDLKAEEEKIQQAINGR